jgi:steroid 5-alpha reductase family enzyme
VKKAFGIVCLAYLAAALAAVVTAVGVAPRGWHPIQVALAADVAATVVIFAASFGFRNSSFYDPYWSVAPPVIALYFALQPAAPETFGLRAVLVFALVLAWAVRLTWNWARGWQGLGHEDWRYVRLQEQSGRAYWLVSFAGIHLMPTLWVFAGCLALYPALAAPTRPFGALDAIAVLVTAGSIWIEKRADDELRRFRREAHGPQAILTTGLWAWSRHPNYFGEMGFWWGLWLFGVSANPAWWWTVAGPVSITLMFRFVSLPMVETRMLERRPDYAAHTKTLPLVMLRPPRRSAG